MCLTGVHHDALKLLLANTRSDGLGHLLSAVPVAVIDDGNLWIWLVCGPLCVELDGLLEIFLAAEANTVSWEDNVKSWELGGCSKSLKNWLAKALKNVSVV